MELTLSATARDSATKAKVLRRAGRIPGVVYGYKTEVASFDCDEVAVTRAYTKAGENTLVELDLAGKKVPVLFHGVQVHPVTDKVIHVDFYAVDLTKEIEVPVPVHIQGEAPAVKNFAGILVTPLDHVTVRCLPTALPKEFVLDVSSLTELTSTLTIAALKVPAGVTIVEEPETMLALIQEKREEVEETPAAPAEGEAAAGAAGAAAPAAEGEKKEEEKK